MSTKKSNKLPEGVICRKDKNGKISWWARVIYFDSNGKRREAVRRAENKSDAKEKRAELRRQYKDHGSSILESANMIFDDLALFYERTYLIKPQYVDGRKVAGLRGHYNQKLFLRTLREHFCNRKLRAITHGDLERFKVTRLATPTKQNKQRAIASVNRELALLRRMLNVAQREGWILRNPFNLGDSLISLADEKQRERIITREEEQRLLDACTGKCAHLRPIIICALDTGLRRGEILSLRRLDIDLEDRLIVARSYKGKNLRERIVAMTPRLAHELELILQKLPEEYAEPIFGVADVKKGFATVRKAAGLSDFRFHDTRHTAATRLAPHMSLAELGRILGHSQPQTTYRYVNANVETARRAAEALDAFNANGVSQDNVSIVH
jgi:integrase